MGGMGLIAGNVQNRVLEQIVSGSHKIAVCKGEDLTQDCEIKFLYLLYPVDATETQIRSEAQERAGKNLKLKNIQIYGVNTKLDQTYLIF